MDDGMVGVGMGVGVFGGFERSHGGEVGSV